MILKDYIHRPDADPKSEETCADAATRLRNAFKSNEDVVVLNDIRVPYDEGRTVNVDHVVLHSYGMTLINSRAIHGKIEINYRGEWSRSIRGREVAMQNPIEMFKYVSRNLRQMMTENIDQLLTRSKGSQKTFENMPIDTLFIQAPKSAIVGTGINNSSIIFAEALTQSINRTFSAYKKREFQMYGGLDTFKISRSDMYAIADFLMGNDIDRSSYPDSNESGETTRTEQAPQGKRGIIKAHSTLPVKIIKGRNIKPGKKKRHEEAGHEAEEEKQDSLSSH
ncbi:nuclease-related domain-containing protein [Marinospirillum perlucidum]|uniref:nuclease-related domain-containing protein n=1 Tax=Marinospirillum perlucidum TaxID=1982602 RepID=UPI001390464E|nr:nuclease-related domain-containing protein [Marinospirillum perlucidum]